MTAGGERPRSVLVTGASSGIGRACAALLARRGWRVFAGVRRDADAHRLAASSRRVHPLHLDVTDQASVAAAARSLRASVGDAGLQGLVNNAGISVQGPVEHLALDALRRQLEVNVIGQVAVTQATLPLLRAGRGRIVMMSSIAGRTTAIPLLSPYFASKAALEALAEGLRLELRGEGIPVSLVEPGPIATAIWTKGDATVDPLVDGLSAEARRRYLPMIERVRALATRAGERGLAPERVARAVERALTARRPRLRYVVGGEARVRAWLEPWAPQAARDALVTRVLGTARPPRD